MLHHVNKAQLNLLDHYCARLVVVNVRRYGKCRGHLSQSVSQLAPLEKQMVEKHKVEERLKAAQHNISSHHDDRHKVANEDYKDEGAPIDVIWTREKVSRLNERGMTSCIGERNTTWARILKRNTEVRR